MKVHFKKISLKDLAILVSKVLKKHNIKAVLTGGACVTIFSDNKYQSLDLDFVTYADKKHIIEALGQIGFKLAAEGFFAHPDCQFIVEFVPPPLAVGSEPVKTIISIGDLLVLSPTDSVKDRLAAYYHWDDSQSLEQAIMVAKKRKVDLMEIKRWSKVERHLSKYNIFVRQLKKK